jgi:hypothetical protein
MPIKSGGGRPPVAKELPIVYYAREEDLQARDAEHVQAWSAVFDTISRAADARPMN